MASKLGEILKTLELMSASEMKCYNPNFDSWRGPQHDTGCTDRQLPPEGILDTTSHLNFMHGERVGIQVHQHNDTIQIQTRSNLQMDTQPTNEYKRALRREMKHLGEQLICIIRMFTDNFTTVSAGDAGDVGQRVCTSPAAVISDGTAPISGYYLSLQTNKKRVDGERNELPRTTALVKLEDVGNIIINSTQMELPDNSTCPRSVPQIEQVLRRRHGGQIRH
jgi:hypothetical protein